MNGLIRKPMLPRDGSLFQDGAAHRVSVAEGYERWAATYDDMPNPVLGLEQRKVLPLIPTIAGKRVLDLACGTGRWLRLLDSLRPALGVGVDVSTAMLRAAEPRTGSLPILHADCCMLPLAHDSFDFAICSFALGHIRQTEQFVQECARVLKRKANLFVTDMHPKAYAAGWRTSFRDERGRVEIETAVRESNEVIGLCGSHGLECTGIDEFGFGEPEMEIFARSGKLAFFPVAREIPAVLFYRFCRVN